MIFKVSDYPGGIAVVYGGFSRLVSLDRFNCDVHCVISFLVGFTSTVHCTCMFLLHSYFLPEIIHVCIIKFHAQFW